MTQQATTTANPTNRQGMLHDLFALTDEQILEIEPEAQDVEIGVTQTASGHAPKANPSTSETQSASQDPSTPAPVRVGASTQDDGKGDGVPGAQPGLAVPQEPPRWVAEAMNDPQRGREARAFWEGAQQAQQEAAAYREVFAKPEAARAAAERARALDDIDRAYFGATGNSAEQTSAARAQLAQLMMRENPAAFREMVFTGLRALEQVGNGTEVTRRNEPAAHTGQQSSHDSSTAGRNVSGPSLGMTENNSGRDAQLAAYAAFEKAANEELEKSVGGAIERTIERALPNAGRGGAGQAQPLQARLSAAVRQDIEAVLKGDRQLSEQIALIISGRRPGDAGTPTPRFDGDTRAQVVRLIGERARQLVPGAAKRVLQDWTQATLASHRSRTNQHETAAARSDLAPANGNAASSRLQSGDNSRPSTRSDTRSGKSAKVDYRKLSDEQILNL